MQTRIIIAALLSLSCVSITANAVENDARSAMDRKPSAMIWDIAQAKVLKPGQLSTNQAGVSLNGYTVEAVAKAAVGDQSPEGKFYVVLNAFRPAPEVGTNNVDKCRWYGRGTWTLVTPKSKDGSAWDAGAGPHPGVLQGHLLAELAASPADNPTNVSADVWAPVQTAREARARYAGSFRGNGHFEGRFSLTAQNVIAKEPDSAELSLTNISSEAAGTRTPSQALNQSAVTNTCNHKE